MSSSTIPPKIFNVVPQFGSIKINHNPVIETLTYRIGSLLGKGTEGVVFNIQFSGVADTYAIKFFHKRDDLSNEAIIKRIIQIHSDIRDGVLVELTGIESLPFHATINGEDVLILKKYSCDFNSLRNLFQSIERTLFYKNVTHLYLEVIEGISTTIDHGYLNLDIAEKNLLLKRTTLLDKPYLGVIADFGLAPTLHPDLKFFIENVNSTYAPCEDMLALEKDGTLFNNSSTDKIAAFNKLKNTALKITTFCLCCCLWGTLVGKEPFDRVLKTYIHYRPSTWKFLETKQIDFEDARLNAVQLPGNLRWILIKNLHPDLEKRATLIELGEQLQATL